MNQKIFAVKEALLRESPAILTGFGVAGLISTAVMAVKDTLKAVDIIDEYRYDVETGMYPNEPLTAKRRLALTWKCYIPTASVVILTGACIIAANSVNARRNAALAGLYSVTVEALREYQEHVIDEIGQKKHEKVIDAVASGRIDKDPPPDSVLVLNSGDVLFYDSYSGRYFLSDMESVRRTINDFNYSLLDEMFKPANDLYDLLGLETIEAGDQLGWNIDRGKLEVHFTAKVVSDQKNKWYNHPCIVMSYEVGPRFE